MKIIGVIPARYQSSRLPGKVLAKIGEKPMIQHVYEKALGSELLEEIYIAVDNQEVYDTVLSFGGKPVMTEPDLPSGTDRVAAVAKDLDVEIVCNIQGDEPFSDPRLIDEAIQPLLDHPKLGFSTVMHVIEESKEYENPGVVKTVRDKDGFGLYFSRSLIPHPRYSEGYAAYEHLGIYAYRKTALMQFIEWEPSPLEKTESLEMLRILEYDEKIYVAESKVPFYALSVDTPEDLAKANEYYQKQKQRRKTK